MSNARRGGGRGARGSGIESGEVHVYVGGGVRRERERKRRDRITESGEKRAQRFYCD